MIILDLEWNRGYDKKALDEILQIGAVRLDHLGGPVTDTFNAYIKPVIHKKFDRGAKSLPELQSSRSSSLTFAAAMELFRTWCGQETEFAFWGGDDLASLAQNCAYWNIPPLPMERVYNFQLALAWLLGTDQQIALWRAVDYCKIPDTFTFHNALNDALYTAMIGRWLTPESLEYKPAPRPKKPRRRISLKLSALPFDPPPEQAVGPFPSAALALDGKSSRRPACPICGRTGCVTQWRFAAPDGNCEYFSIFSCPEHGRFLCRLALSQLEDGSWQGRLTTPAPTPEQIKAYIAACKGSAHQCSRSNRKRHRPKKNSRCSSSAGT